LVLERIKGMATTKKYPVKVQERAVAMVGEPERELGANAARATEGRTSS
jgi:hypothetical protein